MMRKVLCWLFGHKWPTETIWDAPPSEYLGLLMNPRVNIICQRCREVGEGRARVVMRCGLDVIEIGPEHLS